MTDSMSNNNAEIVISWCYFMILLEMVTKQMIKLMKDS